MRIALDAMGGDYAPGVVIEGALLAKKELSSEIQIILIGDQEAIKAELVKRGSSTSEFEIVHTSEVISMAEHPAKAVAAKQDSSIVVGYKMLMAKKADAFCSAGNTGAMLVASMFTIKAIEGVIRPGIAGFIPKCSGKYGVVFDVGANSEVKPEMLAQFAQMGSFYVENYLNISKPTVGLLNLGEEEEKGTAVLQAAHQLIKQNKNINFIGNIEGRDVLTDKADLIVCDGYVGNVVLKMGESLYNIFTERGYKDEFVDMFNWQLVGGSPILGVNGTAVIGHGSSNDLAISNMIKFTVNFTKAGITEKIKNAYSC